jgi:hypothetical protein
MISAIAPSPAAGAHHLIGPPSHATTRRRSKARASVEFLKATAGAYTGRWRSRCACKIVAVGWALREGERP